MKNEARLTAVWLLGILSVVNVLDYCMFCSAQNSFSNVLVGVDKPNYLVLLCVHLLAEFIMILVIPTLVFCADWFICFLFNKEAVKK